jgi:phospholipase C
MAFDQIQHVFVLMLENRSFDHLLGFSGISGIDAVSGLETAVSGLSGSETNSYNGKVATVAQPADYAMMVDPGSEEVWSCGARGQIREGLEVNVWIDPQKTKLEFPSEA